jgi:DNA-binding SARP family transcriptional activator
MHVIATRRKGAHSRGRSRSRSPSRPAGQRGGAARGFLARLLCLIAGLAASGVGLDLLLGPPLLSGNSIGAPLGMLFGHLGDAALQRTLVAVSWLGWAVVSVAALPLSLGPAFSRGGGGGGRSVGQPASAPRDQPLNEFRAAAAAASQGRVRRQPRVASAPRNDTMVPSIARDGRTSELSWRRDPGSAEARMSVEITDGGAVASSDREMRTPDCGVGGPLEAKVVHAVVGLPRHGADTTATVALSALGSLALLGDHDDTLDLMCSMVVDAASGRHGEPVHVVLVGFGEAMHGLDGAVAVRNEREAVALASSSRARAEHELPSDEESGHGPLAAALPWVRQRATVFFVGARRDEGSLSTLIAMANETFSASAVTVDNEAQRAASERPRIPGLMVVVAGQALDARWRLSLGHDTPDGALVRQLGRAAPRPEPKVQVRDELSVATTIEVGVLGPVRFRGAPAGFERRPKLTELVVYLAMHPDGATTDAWATALWPDRRMPLSTVSNRLSETRLALGVAGDGFAHLRKRGGRYHLGPEVTTDWAHFARLAASDDPAAWREALSLLRGRPFEGLREAQWTLLEGVVPAIESAIVEVACRVAEHLLSSRDPEGAEWAARRAMLACPWDERLYRLVMRAADAAGNRAGVDAALRQLACVLELGDEALAGVHPETASLYRSLTMRRAAL